MSHSASGRKIVFLVTMLLLAAVVTASVLSARRQSQTPPAKQRRVRDLPEVVSHVPALQIASVNVKNQGTDQASAVVEIFNTSSLPVMSVEISTKNQAGDSGAVNEDGLLDQDHPYVVIAPNGTKTLQMNFSEMVPDAPLVVSAAVFADGSEQGDQWSRDTMRKVRSHRQALRQSERNQTRKEKQR